MFVYIFCGACILLALFISGLLFGDGDHRSYNGAGFLFALGVIGLCGLGNKIFEDAKNHGYVGYEPDTAVYKVIFKHEYSEDETLVAVYDEKSVKRVFLLKKEFFLSAEIPLDLQRLIVSYQDKKPIYLWQ